MRLIDADALKTKAIKCETFKLYDAPVFLKAVGTKEIDRTPTIDAVEVVRCKDCKYQRKVWIEDKRYKFGGFFCVSCDRNDDIFVSHTVDGDDNDFCSYGERKNEVIE